MKLTKKQIKRIIGDDKVRISHIFNNAYCIAKPAPYMAVFVTPIYEREPQVVDLEYVVIDNKTVEFVKTGDWCVIAYISDVNRGENRLIRIQKIGDKS